LTSKLSSGPPGIRSVSSDSTSAAQSSDSTGVMPDRCTRRGARARTAAAKGGAIAAAAEPFR
jgi:hypothetical protein